MKKIELEFDTNLAGTQQILEKVTQIVKHAEEQGFSLTELELESEEDDKEDDD
jgi:hypothetical protein